MDLRDFTLWVRKARGALLHHELDLLNAVRVGMAGGRAGREYAELLRSAIEQLKHEEPTDADIKASWDELKQLKRG